MLSLIAESLLAATRQNRPSSSDFNGGEPHALNDHEEHERERRRMRHWMDYPH